MKLLKSEQNKKGIANETLQDLHRQITLLSAIITELKLEEKSCKEKLKNCQAYYNEAKKEVETLRETRGKTKWSSSLTHFMCLGQLTMVEIFME
jgi:flagellar biosynthesis chaperone FliJ